MKNNFAKTICRLTAICATCLGGQAFAALQPTPTQQPTSTQMSSTPVNRVDSQDDNTQYSRGDNRYQDNTPYTRGDNRYNQDNMRYGRDDGMYGRDGRYDRDGRFGRGRFGPEDVRFYREGMRSRWDNRFGPEDSRFYRGNTRFNRDYDGMDSDTSFECRGPGCMGQRGRMMDREALRERVRDFREARMMNDEDGNAPMINREAVRERVRDFRDARMNDGNAPMIDREALRTRVNTFRDSRMMDGDRNNQMMDREAIRTRASNIRDSRMMEGDRNNQMMDRNDRMSRDSMNDPNSAQNSAQGWRNSGNTNLYANERTDNQRNTYQVTDDQIRKDVRYELSPGMFSKGYDDEVKGEVSNGVVTLTGSVKTEKDKEKLDKSMRDINGVREVDNRVKVMEPSTR